MLAVMPVKSGLRSYGGLRPDGDSIEIRSNNLYAVSELLRKLS